MQIKYTPKKKYDPVEIGSRVEMLVDNHLIAEIQDEGLELRLTPPQPREIVLQLDQPWEGPGSGPYMTVFFDGKQYRMYYRAMAVIRSEDLLNDYHDRQYTCLATSENGIHWTRPNLNMVEFEGIKETNILNSGMIEGHNFTPMLDLRPDCPKEARFKALSGKVISGLMAYRSEDGIHWEPMAQNAVMTNGAFDSQNLSFYDVQTGEYRMFSRTFIEPKHIRAIQHCTSPDFLHWTEPDLNVYEEGVPYEQFYTNATVQCPGAPHFYLSFPMRFMPERSKDCTQPVGLSDAVFMSSRDGIHFDRTFMEAWIRPNLDPRNWTQRNFITAWGILDLSPEEHSLYVCEHYEWDDAYIRRYTVRKHGFASMHANYTGGRFVTKPLIFDGDKLFLNYATSAVGHVKVGIIDNGTGWPAGMYSSEECDIIYGNELEKVVSWRGKTDLSKFRGKPIRLAFDMKDADLYSFHFGD